jgi:hypothetical protein
MLALGAGRLSQPSQRAVVRVQRQLEKVGWQLMSGC